MEFADIFQALDKLHRELPRYDEVYYPQELGQRALELTQKARTLEDIKAEYDKRIQAYDILITGLGLRS